jgi:hypothetical protein
MMDTEYERSERCVECNSDDICGTIGGEPYCGKCWKKKQAEKKARQARREARQPKTTLPERCPDLDSCPELERLIPPYLLAGLRRYAQEHIPVGGFLQALLENDLCAAVCCAHEDSLAAIVPLVKYVHNALPSACHGSKEAVRAWLDKCEHGVMTGDWCEACNAEYKRAAKEAEDAA